MKRRRKRKKRRRRKKRNSNPRRHRRRKKKRRRMQKAKVKTQSTGTRRMTQRAARRKKVGLSLPSSSGVLSGLRKMSLRRSRQTNASARRRKLMRLLVRRTCERLN